MKISVTEELEIEVNNSREVMKKNGRKKGNGGCGSNSPKQNVKSKNSNRNIKLVSRRSCLSIPSTSKEGIIRKKNTKKGNGGCRSNSSKQNMKSKNGNQNTRFVSRESCLSIPSTSEEGITRKCTTVQKNFSFTSAKDGKDNVFSSEKSKLVFRPHFDRAPDTKEYFGSCKTDRGDEMEWETSFNESETETDNVEASSCLTKTSETADDSVIVLDSSPGKSSDTSNNGYKSSKESLSVVHEVVVISDVEENSPVRLRRKDFNESVTSDVICVSSPVYSKTQLASSEGSDTKSKAKGKGVICVSSSTECVAEPASVESNIKTDSRETEVICVPSACSECNTFRSRVQSDDVICVSSPDDCVIQPSSSEHVNLNSDFRSKIQLSNHKADPKVNDIICVSSTSECLIHTGNECGVRQKRKLNSVKPHVNAVDNSSFVSPLLFQETDSTMPVTWSTVRDKFFFQPWRTGGQNTAQNSRTATRFAKGTKNFRKNKSKTNCKEKFLPTTSEPTEPSNKRFKKNSVIPEADVYITSVKLGNKAVMPSFVHNPDIGSSIATPFVQNKENDTYLSRNCPNVRPVTKKLRPIVIDGSNVAYTHGKRKVFSCKGIEICVKYFQSRGHEVTVFVPQYRRCRSRDVVGKDILESLGDRQIVVFTPSRLVEGVLINSYDDRFILDFAAKTGGIIVSNDNYRDIKNDKPEWRSVVNERLLMYLFVGDIFMVPDDPLGRAGVTLDMFLSFL